MVTAVKDQINNDTIEKFCYNNDPAKCNIYGGLYQWREAVQYTNKQSPRGICPIGWHIPLKTEFDTLISTVSANGNALLQVGQGSGTNTSGFSGLQSGYNSYTLFGNNSINANYWSCFSFYQTHSDPYEAMYLELWNDNSVISGRYYNSDFGLSVRCIKDTTGLLLQSPYSGESWQVGSIHKISWGGDLSGKKINIEYSTDTGASWLNIIDSNPAPDGDYIWTIPNTPSQNCKVRITDLNNPISNSISENVFTIYIPCTPGSVIVHGGQIYHTVVIGNKCWFKENVNIGAMIPGSQEQTQDSIIEKYCYDDDTANCTKYGGLYTYPEMNEPGFCPTFWHTPSSSSFSALIGYVAYDGNALKELGQGSGFGEGTNTSGFSVLMAGFRNSDGTFIYLGQSGWFPYDYFIKPYRIDVNFLNATSSLISSRDDFVTTQAGSTRCVMDDIGPLTLKSPVGGENWQIGTTQSITWGLSNVQNIRIDYTTNNGTSWINIIPTIPTSAGSFNWTIPNTPSTNCKVKITSTNSSDTNSISNLFQIYQVPTNPCPGIPTVTYAGQTYNTIAIGDQCWLKENLNDGTMINGSLSDSANGIIEKYCYNNDSNNCAIYGGLYQWKEAMQYSQIENAQGICPTGWDIPSENDFTTIKNLAGGNGNPLKEVGQGTGTNGIGFSALLAGAAGGDGTYNFLGNDAIFWSSTNYNSTKSYNFELTKTDSTIFQGIFNQIVGLSIRCINNLTVSELPVELTSFIASVIDNNVKLIWNTATEVNTSFFEIYREIYNSSQWLKVSSIQAAGNSSSPKNYHYIDKNVNKGKYSYQIKMIDNNGSFKYTKDIYVEIAEPRKFALSNAYPNPFNPTTTISYKIPVNILVSIKVFDAIGKEILTLVNETKPAGAYDITINSQNLPSGIYYYHMRAGNFIQTKKIILMK
ncbi:MAG: FISUMP domain-containing protein [Ignavibacteriaceae bacterium]|nr:FISUMP domain-containing protein [Ignavibacteriaceae bacterium]